MKNYEQSALLLEKTLKRLNEIDDPTCEEYYKLLDQAERLTDISSKVGDGIHRKEELNFKREQMIQNSEDAKESNKTAINKELISGGTKVLCAAAGIGLGILELTGKSEGIATSTSAFFKRAEKLVDK